MDGAAPVVRYRSRMNLTTSQWRSVSSAMPFWRAIASAIGSFHWLGVGQEALGVDVDRGIGDQGHGHRHVLLAGGDGARFLPAVGIVGPKPGQVTAREQHVPVEPLEQSFPRWLRRDSRSSGSPSAVGKWPGSGSVS